MWRARGPSSSVPVKAVLTRCRDALAAGQAEIVLCGVDLGAYGRDRGTTLAELLHQLLAGVPEARLRLSSINANDVSEDLIGLNAHPRLCPHWHLPLQSGSDRVLRAMHRGYRRRQYQRVVDGLREADPRTEFTTDIMVGFPGESDDDHRQTLSLMDQVSFLACHVFRYSPRAGTPAEAREGRIDDAVARQRSAEVRRVAAGSGAQARRRAVGLVHDVVWDRVQSGRAHGITASYHQLVAPPGELTRPGLIEAVMAHGLQEEYLVGTVMAPSTHG